MKRKLIPALLLTTSLLFTACSSPAANTATTTAKAATTTAKASTEPASGTISAKEFKEYQDKKESEITALKEEIDGLKKDTGKTPDNSALAFSQRPAGMLYFPVISLTQDEVTPYTAGYVAIEPQAPLLQKLEKLTAGLSSILFNGSKIEVTGIKEESGKKVAYINLVNAADWEKKFQGSTGGGINSQALVLTYLQKDYKNSWIDGVHFTMDGKAILLDHAPIFEETQFRK